jgi:hypothetical protein
VVGTIVGLDRGHSGDCAGIGGAPAPSTPPSAPAVIG